MDQWGDHKGSRKYYRMNYNKHTVYQNLYNTAKAALQVQLQYKCL